jgi:hypothetical protein
MVIRGTTRVRCPGCGTEQDAKLVQTIDMRENPADKAQLLSGELNMLVCACGKRTQLVANVLFKQDDYFCQVVPGRGEAGEKAMAEAAAAFAASGITGRRRLVPSVNALVEKVKILDAGLDDRAVEMVKVLLLASVGKLERVLLFDKREGDLVTWLMFDEDGNVHVLSSAVAQIEKLAQRPMADAELRVDRAWAVEAVKAMVSDAN